MTLYFYVALTDPSRNTIGQDQSGAYVLSFTVEFMFANDSVYFALTPPYSYTRLQNTIHSMLSDTSISRHMKVSTLCHSVAGNKIELVTITERSAYVKETEYGAPRNEENYIEKYRGELPLSEHNPTSLAIDFISNSLV
jgi:hypothetical protein